SQKDVFNLKKTLSFLKPYKIQVIIAYILTLTELAIELSLPFLFGKMINEGVVTERIDIVLYWGVILLVLTFISFSSGILNSFYSSHTSHSFAYDVRHALLQKIQSFSYPVFNSLSTSKLVTHFTNDIRQVQTAIFMALRIMLRAPLLI